jgi:ParB family chromosome partitioning protein
MTTTTEPATDQSADTEGHVLVWRRPADLAAHPLNVRHDLGDLTGMVKTIRTVGVIQPFVIVPTADGEKVLAGHRRLAAAVEAGTELVPCYVRPDLADDVTQVTAMLVENGQRRDLSVTEEAQGYQQLAAFELSAAQIAKATGQKLGHVKTALTVAGSDVALAVTDRYDLTLDQAATLAEFADDADAVKDLTVTAKRDPRGWDHVVSRLRQDRADAQAAAELVAQLTEAGVTVVDRNDLADAAVSISDLLDTDGNRITPEGHATCLGHMAAVVKDWSGVGAAYFCTDPLGHGHADRFKNRSAAAAPMSDEQKEERREVVANNRAWRAAQPVRHEFVKSLVARRTPPKGTLRWVTEAVVTSPSQLEKADEDFLAALCGTKPGTHWQRTSGPSAAAAATDARLPLVLFAQVAGAVEKSMEHPCWRNSSAEQARYLTFLAEVGYATSEVEQLVIDTHAAKAARRRTRKATGPTGHEEASDAA